MPSARLHDVDNVEAFCSRILDSVLRANGGFLRAEQREEATSFLVVVCVERATVYRPGTVPFSQYAGWILSRRMTDWYRSVLGDQRAQTKRPLSVSYDELTDEAGERGWTPLSLVAESHEDEVLTRVALG